MRIKHGVQVHGLSSEILLAITICNQVYQHFGLVMTITSICDGKHRTGSLHYTGDAVDLRTRDVPADVMDTLVQSIRVALIPDYDVVLEKDHLHLEFQPKGV